MGVALSHHRPARSLAGWFLAAVLAVAACSDDPLPGTAAPTTSVGEAPGDAGAPPATPGSGATGTAPATSNGAAPGATGTPPAPAGTAGVPGEAEPPPPPGEVGTYAPIFLRPDTAARIVLEIRSQDGAEPAASTTAHLRDTLADVTGKEVVLSGGAVDGGARDWTAADVRTAADASSLRQSGGAPVMRILFLRGGFAEADTVVGIAVRADAAAVFSDRVDEAAGLVGDRDRVERAVTLHEAGHLLGLVDLVLDTGRQDPDHPGHSTNRGSVMYHAVESTLVGTILSGGPPTQFDEQDRADLKAIGRGA